MSRSKKNIKKEEKKKTKIDDDNDDSYEGNDERPYLTVSY